MKYKIIFLIVSFLLILFGKTVSFPEKFFAWCPTKLDTSTLYEICIQPYRFIDFGHPMYIAGLYLLPTALLLFAMTKQSFKAWKKLAVWFIPLAIVIITQQEGQSLANPFDIGKSKTTIVFGIIFLILSIFILILGRIPKKK